MARDDSFKKPGAVPFKWEIRPGVPKVQERRDQQPLNDQNNSIVQQHSDRHRSFPSTPQKLRPPPRPAGFYFQPPPELRTRSFRSAPRTRFERYHFDGLICARPERVSTGCLPTSLLRRKDDKKKLNKSKFEYEFEYDYTLDIEIISRWSMSTQKSLQPFWYSRSSSSSHQSSARPVCDDEGAGFELF